MSYSKTILRKRCFYGEKSQLISKGEMAGKGIGGTRGQVPCPTIFERLGTMISSCYFFLRQYLRYFALLNLAINFLILKLHILMKAQNSCQIYTEFSKSFLFSVYILFSITDVVYFINNSIRDKSKLTWSLLLLNGQVKKQLESSNIY